MRIELEPPFVVTKPGVSEAEFYALLGEDDPWERVDGELRMSPASDRCEDVFRFLLTVVSAYLDERGGAVVRGSRYPMRLDEQWSPEPDLLVVRDENRHRLGPKCLAGAADWVVEISSESDRRFDRFTKLPRYQAAEIGEIWLIDPALSQLLVSTRGTAGYSDRELSAGKLEATMVPGLWIEVGWLWQATLPSTMACLRQILEPR